MRIVVGITGASGAVYGWSLLKALHNLNVETHVVISRQGEQVLSYECGIGKEDVRRVVTCLYDVQDLGARIASGTFPVDATIVAPCSMHTLGLIARGIAANLIARAADVALKERRRLILLPRETPLSAIHLENMLRLARLGVYIVPASPGFYHRPSSLDELIQWQVGKLLDCAGVVGFHYKRWQGV